MDAHPDVRGEGPEMTHITPRSPKFSVPDDTPVEAVEYGLIAKSGADESAPVTTKLTAREMAGSCVTRTEPEDSDAVTVLNQM